MKNDLFCLYLDGTCVQKGKRCIEKKEEYIKKENKKIFCKDEQEQLVHEECLTVVILSKRCGAIFVVCIVRIYSFISLISKFQACLHLLIQICLGYTFIHLPLLMKHRFIIILPKVKTNMSNLKVDSKIQVAMIHLNVSELEKKKFSQTSWQVSKSRSNWNFRKG